MLKRLTDSASRKYQDDAATVLRIAVIRLSLDAFALT
jgi:hypothetical protein